MTYKKFKIGIVPDKLLQAKLESGQNTCICCTRNIILWDWFWTYYPFIYIEHVCNRNTSTQSPYSYFNILVCAFLNVRSFKHKFRHRSVFVCNGDYGKSAAFVLSSFWMLRSICLMVTIAEAVQFKYFQYFEVGIYGTKSCLSGQTYREINSTGKGINIQHADIVTWFL